MPNKIQPDISVTFVYDNCDHNAESICNVTLHGTTRIVIQPSKNFMGQYHTLLNLQLADAAHLNLFHKNFSHKSKVNIDQSHCRGLCGNIYDSVESDNEVEDNNENDNADDNAQNI